MKQNKKGFTLVELLAVIAIMAILVMVAVPSYLAISKKIKSNMRDSKIATVETAAELWAQDNKNGCNTNLSIKTLISEGYLKADNNDGDINDPVDNTSWKDKSVNNLGIDMEKICENVKANIEEVSSTTYIASINNALKSSGIKYDDISGNLSNTFRPSITAAYEACTKNPNISNCDLLSSSNFTATDSDYEDYRVRKDSNSNLVVYRAYYKYNITFYTDNKVYKTLETKVDDDNASDMLDFNMPTGYTFDRSDCYRLYYDEVDRNFQIYTSGKIEENVTCSIYLVKDYSTN